MTDKQQPKTDPQGTIPGNQSPNTPNVRESDGSQKERDGSQQKRTTDPQGDIPGNQSPNTPNVRESDTPERQRANKDR
jgi:hypothetical protein